jgi:hypothetical protein
LFLANISMSVNVLRRKSVSNLYELETEAVRRTAEIGADAAQARLVRASGAHRRWLPDLVTLLTAWTRAVLSSGAPAPVYRPPAAGCPAAA